MRKIGVSCGKLVRMLGVDRAFEVCKKSGFDSVDYNLESYKPNDAIYGGSDDAFESHFDSIRKKALEYELEISQTHGRCGTYMPDNEAHNAFVDTVCHLDLRATSVLGAPACVIHFPNNTRWGKQPSELMHQVSGEMFDKYIPTAEKYKVKIALETFGAARVSGARIRDFFAAPQEFLRQYNRLDTKYKTICVDTGHTHEAESFWVPPPEEMIRILGSDISILHLHDNSGHWDDHLLPGMGNIKWPEVFDALDDVGYKGVFNFEISYGYMGCMIEEYFAFIGKYLRTFVDRRGNMKR